MKAGSDSAVDYEKAVSANYLFIRSISTCTGLPTTQSSQYIEGVLQTLSIDEMINIKVCGFTFQLLHEDFHQAIERSLHEQQAPSATVAAASTTQTKKKKKKNKKKQAATEDEPTEATAATTEPENQETKATS